MKDRIFEYLRTNFADLGLSKEILGGYAELLAATVTEENGIAAAVETIRPLLVIQQKENDKIRQKYAAERDKAEKEKQDKQAQKEEKTADVKTEEKKESNAVNNDKESKPTGGEEVPEYVKKMMKEINDLKTSIKNKDRALELGNRRKEINSIIEKLPKSIQKAYEQMDLDIPEDDYAALKDAVTKQVPDIITEFNQRKSVFNPPYAGQGDGEQTKEISKERADRIADRLLNR